MRFQIILCFLPRVLVTVLAMGFVASCTRPAELPADVSDVEINLSRSRCAGECPHYTVTIYGDGTVVYEGEHFVAVEGRQESQIDPADVAILVAEFYAIDYFSLDDEYTADITDMATTTTSISVEGQTKTVINYFDAPQKLIDLESGIDRVANTAQWVTRR